MAAMVFAEISFGAAPRHQDGTDHDIGSCAEPLNRPLVGGDRSISCVETPRQLFGRPRTVCGRP